MNDDSKTNVVESIATLAVAADLVKCVVFNVLGHEIATTICGEQVTDKVITDMAMSGFQTHLKQNKG